MGAGGSRVTSDRYAEAVPMDYRVVIPCLNEEGQVANAVKSALQRGQTALKSVSAVVVDGGSTDGTVKAAQRAGAEVLHSKRGRGPQMNCGAGGARDDQLLLFLHADSQLPVRYGASISEAFERYSARMARHGQWGCFSTIQLDKPGLRSALLRATVSLRTRLLHLPYGDQAIFVRGQAFREIGGYKEVPLMEDVDLVRRLRTRFGAPVIVPGAVVTSSRRWDRLGFVRTTLLNQAIMAAWAMGTPPETLASWYYGARQLSEKRAQK
ncbi:g2721 [Coccomyxa elongata]